MSTANSHPTRIEERMLEQSNRECIDRVSRRLAKLEAQKFYGELVVRLKEGKISLLTVNQALRPEDI